MVQNITTANAVSMYKSQIQQQITQATPLQRIMKNHFLTVVGGKQINFSLTDILRELTNNSQYGQKLAVQWAQSQKDASDNPLYAVTS